MKARNLVTIVSALALVALVAGCGGGSSASQPADREAASQVLRQALDAWKQGEPHNGPAQSDPPVRVADEDWLGGTKLIDYQLGPDQQESGSTLICPVTLTLKTPNGREMRRQVAYNVVLTPSPSVIRQD